MTLFIGGPYDGFDLPIDPQNEVIWLPAKDELATFLADVQSTANITWVNRYRRDRSAEPAVYRYAMEMGTVSVEEERPPLKQV